MTSDLRAVTTVLALMIWACGGDEPAGDRNPAGACDAFATAACLDGARMMSDVELLAGPDYAGRRAGTDDAARAAALVEGRFRDAGLAPPAGNGGFLQQFAFEQWVPLATSLSIGGVPTPLGAGYEVVYDSASASVPATELVFVGYGLRVPPYSRAAYPTCPFPESGYDDFANLSLDGKIALALRGYPAGDVAIQGCPAHPDASSCTPSSDPATPGRCHTRVWTKARHAAANGAVGLLLVRPYWDPEGGATTPFSSAGLPVLSTLLLDRATIERAVPNLPGWAAEIDAQRAPSSHATGVVAAVTVEGEYRVLLASNVIGLVLGGDPALAGEAVVVGAHLDHMGRLPFRDTYFAGADDNASGTAVLLELARAVAGSPTRPNRTILFAAWNAEEEGLIGSCHYVEQDPLHPLDATVAAFSVDMVGAGTPGLELWGATEWPWLADATDRGAAGLGLPWRSSPRPPLTASDHACFREHGIPALLVSTPTILQHPSYHTVGDVAEGVSRENLEASARLLWAGVREIAMGRAPGAAASTARSTLSRATVESATSTAAPPRYLARPRSAFEQE
jgi:Peptidase family M28